MNDYDFMTEEEREILGEELLNDFGKMVEADESGSYMLNMERCREMIEAYKVFKKLSKGRGTRTTIKLNEPYPSMGSITVCGRNVNFLDSDGFMAVAAAADNLDAYPLTDGKLKVTFTFHGLTHKIEGV